MGHKDDASTNIDTVVAAFIKDISTAATDLLKDDGASGGKGADPKKAGAKAATPKITFAVGKSDTAGIRTPAQQAALVVAGSSWSCWSAHMADRARDLLMKVDGKVSFKPRIVFGKSFDAFKKEWGSQMKAHGLKNFKGTDGWADGDEFHVELDHSKVKHGDERADACLAEYVRLTRVEGGKPNAKFEAKHAKDLKPYIDAVEKKGAKK